MKNVENIEDAIQEMKLNGNNYVFLNENFQNNELIIKEALKNKPFIYRSLKSNFKESLDITRFVINIAPQIIKSGFISEKMINNVINSLDDNEELTKKLLMTPEWSFTLIKEKYSNSEYHVNLALDARNAVLHWANETLKSKKYLVLKQGRLNKGYLSEKNITKKLLKDRDILLLCLTSLGPKELFFNVPDEYWKDMSFIEEGLFLRHNYFFSHIPKKYKGLEVLYSTFCYMQSEYAGLVDKSDIMRLYLELPKEMQSECNTENFEEYLVSKLREKIFINSVKEISINNSAKSGKLKI